MRAVILPWMVAFLGAVALLFAPVGSAEDSVGQATSDNGSVVPSTLDLASDAYEASKEERDDPLLSENEAPDPEKSAATSSPPPLASSPASRAVKPQPTSWGIPPVPWRSSVSLGGGVTKDANGTVSSSRRTDLSASANSFILAPWFVKVDGSANVVKSEVQQSSQSSMDVTSIGATTNLQVVPLSRYPLSLSLGMTNTSNSGDTQTTNIHRSVFVRQSYRPLQGLYFASGAYGRRDFYMSDSGRSQSQDITANFDAPSPGENPQNFKSGVSFSELDSDYGVKSSSSTVFGSHHIYLDDYVMNINNDVRNTETSDRGRVISGVPAYEYSSDVLQINSRFDWLPSDDYPLTLDGGLRSYDQALGSQADADSSKLELSTTNLDLRANYPVGQYWNFSAEIVAERIRQKYESVNESKRSVETRLNANWSRSENYRKNFEIWVYDLTYGGNAAARISNKQTTPASTTESSDTSVASAGVSGSQTLSRTVVVEEQSPAMTLSFRQQYQGSKYSSIEANHTVIHGFDSRWTRIASSDSQVAFSFSATDTRSFGATRTEYQSILGSLDSDTVLSGYSSITGYLSMTFNRQTSSGYGSGRSEWIGSGGGRIGYSHSRFADVTGLTYGADYSFALRPRSVYGSGGGSDGFDLIHDVSQRWSWRLGFLSWEVSNTYSLDPNGRAVASVNFSVRRDFGGVL